MIAPLEDPQYVPKHPPEQGFVPWVVEKWGARSQVRWFRRFEGQLHPQRYPYWERYFRDSILHLGRCCSSCIADYEDGYDSPHEGHCCCRTFDVPATPPGGPRP